MSDETTPTPPGGDPPAGDDAALPPPPAGEGPDLAQAAADAAAGDPPAVAPACEECHAPLEPEQPYCLVCGAPTPRAPRLRPRRRSAGLWIAVALLASAIAVGAVWWAATRDDEAGTATPTTGSSTGLSVPFTDTFGTMPTTGGLPPDTTGQFPSVTTETVTGPPTVSTFPTSPLTDPFTTSTVGPTDTVPTDPFDPSTETDDPLTDTGTETFPTVTDVASDWPSGTSAWTVIIASTTDASSATATRDKAEGQGFSPGILRSGEHQGLRAGYFVVYVGEYQSRAAVIRRVTQLKQYYPLAYPRYINA